MVLRIKKNFYFRDVKVKDPYNIFVKKFVNSWSNIQCIINIPLFHSIILFSNDITILTIVIHSLKYTFKHIIYSYNKTLRWLLLHQWRKIFWGRNVFPNRSSVSIISFLEINFCRAVFFVRTVISLNQNKCHI